jgi:hypothetical protein
MTTNDTRLFLRDLALLLGIPALLVVGGLALWRPWEVRRFAAGSPEEVFGIAAGVWDWHDADSFCVSNPHRIWFSTDRSRMYIYYTQPWTDSLGGTDSGAVYEIREHSASHIRGFILDETRRTPAGELVVWDLVLTSPNSYAWHRTDWEPGGLTKEINRCQAEAEAVAPQAWTPSPAQ